MAKTLQVKADIIADSGSYVAGVKRAMAATDKFNRSTKTVKRNPFNSVTRSVVGLAGAYIGTQGLITVMQGAVREQQQSIKVGRQTNAVLTSTKGAAGMSAKAVRDLGNALSEKTAIDNDAVQAAENLLLTFTKIGKDTFPSATQAVLDLSVATGTSLKGASIQVGKALQDPIKGVTALRKVGVSFSTDQTNVIKKLVETGKTAEAQKLILKELGTEFGGSAAAAATPLDRLKTTYQNLLETLGGYLVPVLNDVAKATMKFVDEFRKGTGPGGKFKDTLKGIYDTLKPIVQFLVKHPALVAGAAAAYVAFKATLGGIKLFNTLVEGLGGISRWTAAGRARGAAMGQGAAAGAGAQGGAFGAVGTKFGRLMGAAAALSMIPLIVEEWKALKAENISTNQDLKPATWNSIKNDPRTKKWITGDANWMTYEMAVALGKGGTKIGHGISSALKKAKAAGILSAGSFNGVGSTAASRAAQGVKDNRQKILREVTRAVTAAQAAGVIKAATLRVVGSNMAHGIAAGIAGAVQSVVDAAVKAVQDAKRAADRAAQSKSPSRLFMEVGKNLVAGMALGMRDTSSLAKAAGKMVHAAKPDLGFVSASGGIKAAGSFGLGSEVANQQALLKAQALVRSSKGKAKTRAENALSRLETRQAAQAARSSARDTLKGFVEGIYDQIKATKLASIMAPITAARDARAARDFGTSSTGLGSAITRAQAEAADPKVQARYQRDAARLDARIIQARKAGNLEALDALQGEKDALDARYGPQYLAGLQDQLAQLNENEVERTSEAAATAFADTFTAGMKGALDALFAGGTVEGFFNQLKAVLTGSGVSPGAITGAAGAGDAAALLSGTTGSGTPVAGGIKTWNQRISELLLTRPKGTHNASDVAAWLGTTRANVWSHRLPLPKNHKMANRASGGYLSPGALTMVGETGPELVVGGKVNSATRTSRMGAGGMNITINAVGNAANDPVALARELGWQLATR